MFLLCCVLAGCDRHYRTVQCPDGTTVSGTSHINCDGHEGVKR